MNDQIKNDKEVKKSLKASKSVNRTTPISKKRESENVESSFKQNVDKSATNEITEKAKTKDDNDISWSQNQQKILESTIKQYPKGTDQRWEKIAEHIPGKSKVINSIECSLVVSASCFLHTREHYDEK